MLAFPSHGLRTSKMNGSIEYVSIVFREMIWVGQLTAINGDFGNTAGGFADMALFW